MVMYIFLIFMAGFSDIAKPLNDLLRNGVSFQRGP